MVSWPIVFLPFESSDVVMTGREEQEWFIGGVGLDSCTCSNADMQTSALLGLVEHAANLFGEDWVRLDAAEEEPDDGAYVAVVRQSELPDVAMLRFRKVDRESLDLR